MSNSTLKVFKKVENKMWQFSSYIAYSSLSVDSSL